MWLLPVFSLVSRAFARIYYRTTVTGTDVPTTGPVLLVANHPNSLLDPVLVAAAARRPVRFLAKAPLFSDPKVGWLVRGSGAIPVYRRTDDPAGAVHNVEMFRAAYDALGGGAAIGIFPEGESHSEPSLLELKTGAARIALGTFARHPTVIHIIPVGLVLRQKDVFRSAALIVLGQPVAWADIADRGSEDHVAVRTLTERIDRALRDVTLNVERWEDKPLVECAEAIWAAEWGARSDGAERVARLAVTTKLLADVRNRAESDGDHLIRDVAAYCRRLNRLRFHPSQLGADVRLSTGLRWTARRLHLMALPAVVLALATFALFWIPYRVTGVLAVAARPPVDRLSTHKLLVGVAVYTLWILALTLMIGMWAGLLAALGALVAIPLLGFIGLQIRERWRGAWSDVRRFFLLRSRRELVETLRQRQREIAVRLRDLYESRAGDSG